MTGVLGFTTRRLTVAIAMMILAIAATAVFASTARAGGVDTDNGTLDGAIYNATPYTWTLVAEQAPATCVSQFTSCFVNPPAATLAPGGGFVWKIAPNVFYYPVIGRSVQLQDRLRRVLHLQDHTAHRSTGVPDGRAQPVLLHVHVRLQPTVPRGVHHLVAAQRELRSGNRGGICRGSDQQRGGAGRGGHALPVRHDPLARRTAHGRRLHPAGAGARQSPEPVVFRWWRYHLLVHAGWSDRLRARHPHEYRLWLHLHRRRGGGGTGGQSGSPSSATKTPLKTDPSWVRGPIHGLGDGQPHGGRERHRRY